MNDVELAADHEGKFRFYFVALIFTILGLAVQSAPLIASTASRIAELISWFLLLISGLTALAYLEWSPTVRIAMVRLDAQRAQLAKLLEAQRQGVHQVLNQADGTRVAVADQVSNTEQAVAKLETNKNKHERRNEIRYQFTRWTFLAGIVALGVARGYPLAEQILDAFHIPA